MAFTVFSSAGKLATIDQFILLRFTIQPGTISMIEVSLSSASVDESYSNYLRFTVTLSQPAIDVVTVGYGPYFNGTASDNDIYYASTSTSNTGLLTFTPGETSKDILIRANSDSLDEVDEAITLQLYNLSSNAVFAGGTPIAQAFGVIRDDDGVSSNLAVFVSDPVVVESDSGTNEAVFEIMLSQPATSRFTLSYHTANGSAISGQDYSPVNGSVEFLPGQSVARVSVPITADTRAETSEQFQLIVTPPSSLIIDTAGAVGNALILDDDTATTPVVSMHTETVRESYSYYLQVQLFLSEPPVDAVTMSYRTLLDQTASSSDVYYRNYGSTNNSTVTFAPGETRKDIQIRINSDTVDERDEAFTVELFNLTDNAVFNGGGNTLSTRAVILDDDGLGPNLSLFVSDPILIEGESGIKQAVFDITLSRPADTAFTVEWNTVNITAIAGEDYAARSGVLTFEEGQDRTSIIVNVFGDEIEEPTESFGLNITAPSNISLNDMGLSGEATILDDDTSELPVLSFQRVDDADESYYNYIRYVVTLSEPSAVPVTVEYEARLGTASDADLYYGSTHSNNNGTLTIDAGQTSASIFIRSTTDTIDERDESILLTLRNATGAALAGGTDSLTAIGFIQDDDGAGLNIAMAGVPTTVTEPISGTKVIEVPVELSRAAESELSFDVVINGGTATAGSDFRLIDNQITFDPGQVTTGVRIQVLGDFVNEGLESILLNYSPVAGAAFAGPILDHQITIANYTVATEGDDVIHGSNAADDVNALGGNDRVLGNGGNDTLRGGDGADTLIGGDGDDFIFGGETSADLRDIIYAGEGNDSIDGGWGNDSLRGDAGNDTIAGGFGVDTVLGGDGDDVMTGSAFSDRLSGGNGDDFINGGFGYDRVGGDAGADKFFHVGIKGHGSDWIRDYDAAEGDLLLSGLRNSSADDYRVNFAVTPGAGDASVAEAFVRYIPTGQNLWALVDGGAQTEINLQIGGVTYDLLA